MTSRVAWFTLAAATLLVLTRASVATVVQIHGDGMAPTIIDGESVLMVRGALGIEAGDIVVYDPSPPPPYQESEADRDVAKRPLDGPAGPSEGERVIDPDRLARGELRNTAVVDVDDVESNWQRVRERGQQAPRNFRVGRVLAVPGDTVTFHVPDAALGLVVNGRALTQKPDDPIRL
ncbi:MAG: S24/S26 family peptidase, partial [Myxococcales bacterium]|nr:S24/S26 family peptidase [Myxococcales bacterium]